MATIIRKEALHSWQGEPLHPLLQRVYLLRNVCSQEEIENDLKALFPFHSLLDIQKAVECLVNALLLQHRILIVGDFDADGATSTALAVSALRQFGAGCVDFLVPNRFEYGYGLTPEIVAVAKTKTPDLIITVDNGISSLAGVKTANEAGIKVLITDHHLPGKQLPDAEAIVNPNLPDDPFPSKNLAGVGVIFYLMLALRSELRARNWFLTKHIGEPNMADLLDLVALGTVADVVKLDKNNRILVHQGLQRIRAGKCRPGIQALIEISGCNAKRLLSGDLGFSIAPRLNAAGRLEDMSLGIHCLLSEDLNAALEFAMQLDSLNQERKVIESEMKEQAVAALKKFHISENLPRGVCLYDSTWHQGVIGIVASRIKEKIHRPVIAFAKVDAENLKGSARSVKGVHIRDVLDAIAAQYPGLITKFGGHAMAAGLSLPIKNYEVFEKIFAKEVAKWLKEEDLQDTIYSDGELSLEEFSLNIAELLREAGPWGQGFPEPLFDNVFILVEQRIVGAHHLKLLLKLPEEECFIDGIVFNIDINQWPNHRCQQVRAVYRLDINEYRGVQKLQLIIQHLEPC